MQLRAAYFVNIRRPMSQGQVPADKEKSRYYIKLQLDRKLGVKKKHTHTPSDECSQLTCCGDKHINRIVYLSQGVKRVRSP